MSAPSERGLSGKVSGLGREPTAGELGIADGPSDEYRSGPSEPTNDYPPLREIRAHVCAACIAREGSECHTPGCLFWLHSAEDLPPTLDIYVDPPADLPTTLASVDDVRSICELAGLSRAGVSHPAWHDDRVSVEQIGGGGWRLHQFDGSTWTGRYADLASRATGDLLWRSIQTARSAS